MRKLLYVFDPYAFTFNKSMFYMYLCSSSAIHFHSLNPKMGLAASPSPIFCCNKFSSSPRKKQLNAPFSPRAKDAHQPSLNLKPIHTNLLHSPLPNQILIQRSFSSRNTRFSLVPFGAKSSGSGEEDRRALETVLKLYTAIKDRNLRELSDVIGDECRCVCNFISFSHPLYGKKQVLEFFFSLMEYMGKHMEFVVQPTLHDGMNVGVAWKLEWKDTHMPLGKGFSFYMCHTYQGRMVIRNVEMFMEPLLHMEPIRLKMMGFVMSVLDKTGLQFSITSKRRRAMYILLTLVFIVAVLLLLKRSFF